MKAIVEFVKTCVVGGFFGILPILLIALVLGEAIEMLGGISAPVAEALPVDELGGVEVARLVAVAIILGSCFLAGLLLRTRFGSWSTGLVEDAILNRVPGYRMIKAVTQRLGGIDEGTLFSAALVDLHGSESRALAFVVEEHDDGRLTVLVPNAPTPTVGTLYVLPQGRVQPLAAPPAAALNCFTQWGIGSRRLLAPQG